jgi:hypothetical protein
MRLTLPSGEIKAVHCVESHLRRAKLAELHISGSFALTSLNLISTPFSFPATSVYLAVFTHVVRVQVDKFEFTKRLEDGAEVFDAERVRHAGDE